jgi:hypothetical protein
MQQYLHYELDTKNIEKKKSLKMINSKEQEIILYFNYLNKTDFAGNI